MAKREKHVRRTGVDNYSSWSAWYQWQEANKIAHVSFAEVDKYAKDNGLDWPVADAILNKDYYEAQAEWRENNFRSQASREQEAQIRNAELDSAISVFQKADRILTNTSVCLFLNDVEEQASAAWNNGKDITFNASRIQSLDSDTVTSLHGLNYHEVAHLMFTPRAGTVLGKWLLETKEEEEEVRHTPDRRWVLDASGNWQWEDIPLEEREEEVMFTRKYTAPVNPNRAIAFNILEDCRIETLLIEKYPSVHPFLVATVADYVISHPDNIGDSFILLAGRRFMPRGLRHLSAKLYANAYGEEQAKKVFEIVSEYRTLAYPRDYERGMELIEAFSRLLPDNPDTPNGCAGREPMSGGRPTSQKEQDALVKRVKDGEETDDLFGEPSVGSGKGTNTGDIDEATADFAEVSAELVEQLNETVKRAKADKVLRDKVKSTERAISRVSNATPLLSKQNSKPDEPKYNEVTASRLFGQELERIRIDSDPWWLLEKPTGKLNVRRAMNADVNDINKLFDRWETGNDDYDIEASILLDRSGSMYQSMGSVCRSAWVIKRAIEKIGGKVSVMTFNDQARYLYTRDERASASVVKMAEASGGTQPYYALAETDRIMKQSTAKTKLVFILTDGGFDDTERNDKRIAQLKADGVYVTVVFLGQAEYIERLSANPEWLKSVQHGAHTFRAISSASDLTKVAKDVVRHLLNPSKTAY